LVIDHGGLHVLAPQQFPNRPDIVAAFQQMRGEGMPERVASGAFVRLVNPTLPTLRRTAFQDE